MIFVIGILTYIAVGILTSRPCSGEDYRWARVAAVLMWPFPYEGA